MKEALKLALDLAIMHHSDDGYAELRSKVRQLAKEALAPTSTQCEVQPEQEVDWKDQYEKQKRRAEMWLAKYEEVAGPAPCAVPLAQPDYRAVKTYHEGKPVYVSQPEQEPVAWEQFYPDIGKPQLGQEPVAFSCLRCVTPKKCAVHGCSPNTWPSEFSPKRPWVGLTDEEASWCQAPSTIQTWKRIEAALKEKNT